MHSSLLFVRNDKYLHEAGIHFVRETSQLLRFLPMTSFCKCLYLRRFLPTVEMTQPMRARGLGNIGREAPDFPQPIQPCVKPGLFDRREKSIPPCHSIPPVDELESVFFEKYTSPCSLFSLNNF